MKLVGDLQEIKSDLCDIQIEKILLTSKLYREDIVLNFVHDDWTIEYNEGGGNSSFACYFYGIVPELLEMIGHTSRQITYMKLFGKAYNAISGNKVNVIWNVPCEMKVDQLEISKDEDQWTVTYLRLVGEIW